MEKEKKTRKEVSLEQDTTIEVEVIEIKNEPVQEEQAQEAPKHSFWRG